MADVGSNRRASRAARQIVRFACAALDRAMGERAFANRGELDQQLALAAQLDALGNPHPTAPGGNVQLPPLFKTINIGRRQLQNAANVASPFRLASRVDARQAFRLPFRLGSFGKFIFSDELKAWRFDHVHQLEKAAVKRGSGLSSSS